MIEALEMDPLVKRGNESEMMERSARNDIKKARPEALNVVGSRDANNDLVNNFCAIIFTTPC